MIEEVRRQFKDIPGLLEGKAKAELERDFKYLARLWGEIAGVAAFDAKKEDAFEELEVVEDHIDEAELRIEEKETRLDQLEDERETALEYQDLKEEKAEYESYRKAAELEDKRADLADPVRVVALEHRQHADRLLPPEDDRRVGALAKQELDRVDEVVRFADSDVLPVHHLPHRDVRVHVPIVGTQRGKRYLEKTYGGLPRRY